MYEPWILNSYKDGEFYVIHSTASTKVQGEDGEQFNRKESTWSEAEWGSDVASQVENIVTDGELGWESTFTSLNTTNHFIQVSINIRTVLQK